MARTWAQAVAFACLTLLLAASAAVAAPRDGATAPQRVSAPQRGATAPAPRFFARGGSPWNTPFSAFAGVVPLRPDSRALADDLERQRRYGMGIEQRMWTSPVFVVRSTDPFPRRRIHLGGVDARRTDPRTGATDAVTNLAFLLHHGIDGEGWPIPPWAAGDPSGPDDGHMTLYVQDTGQYVELYGARRQGDGSFVAAWGGYIHDARTNIGRYEDRDVRGLDWSHRHWGPLGGSNPIAAGLILEREIRAAYAAHRRGDHERAVIPHALGLNVHAHTRNTWVWPAQRTDFTTVYGRGGKPIQEGPVEMGQIFRLPADLDVRALHGGSARETALLQIVARTIQRHGTIVWDQTGGGLRLRGEQLRDRDGSLDEMFDYGRADRWLAALPLDRFQAVETRDQAARGYRPAG